MGRDVAICTLSMDTIAHMPCNPAIGGTAKGHLVREIDALGGLMGIAIDATAIQFKLLNRSRGPAVWSPRAQADKRRYSEWVRRALEREPNISCHLVHTTDRVHALVRAHIEQSPLYNGQISGIGPRYCPSLEDKVMRFPDRERHQIYLEPEGLDVDEIYINGFSMS